MTFEKFLTELLYTYLTTKVKPTVEPGLDNIRINNLICCFAFEFHDTFYPRF